MGEIFSQNFMQVPLKKALWV